MSNNKIIWLENVRALACILVILVHVCGYYIAFSSTNSGNTWDIPNVIDSISRICVPLFFMISGYLFFSERRPTLKNYIKLISALIFYSVMAIVIFNIYNYFHPDSEVSINYIFLTGPTYFHLWFFYPLISIYIMAYFINVRSAPVIPSIALITLLFVIFNPKLSNLTNEIYGQREYFYFMIDGEFFYYFLYAISGGVIRNLSINDSIKKNTMYFSLIIWMISVFGIIYITNSNNNENLKLTEVFYNYNSILVFLSSISTFVFFKSLDNKKENKTLRLIASNSLGIYGFHAPVLLIIQKLIDYQYKPALIWIPIIFLSVFSVSLILSLLVKKFDKKDYVS